MKLKIEVLKLFLLEFEWNKNKKEKTDDQVSDDIVPAIDAPK
jgi:hypothetical protein